MNVRSGRTIIGFIVTTLFVLLLGQIAWSATLSVNKPSYSVSVGSTTDGVVKFTDGSDAAGGHLELATATTSVATVSPTSIPMTIGPNGYVEINQVFTLTGKSAGSTILTVRGIDKYGKEYIKVTANVSVSDCPISLSLEDSSDEGLLGPFYRFRDQVLTKTARGREYIRQYYCHAWEGCYLLLRHEELLEQSQHILLQILPVIEARLAGHEANLSAADLADIDNLLAAIEPLASPGLKETIRKLRTDLENGEISSQIGISRSRR